jgi:hypothetical protein
VGWDLLCSPRVWRVVNLHGVSELADEVEGDIDLLPLESCHEGIVLCVVDDSIKLNPKLLFSFSFSFFFFPFFHVFFF